MMTTHKTNRSAAWKYALVLPILICLVFIFSCKESQVTDITTAEPKTETTPKSSPEIYTDAEMENVFKVTEEMPRFPGCEDINDIKERKTCADKKMLQYIYENLNYPTEAKEAGIEGQCVIQFIVAIDGSIENIKVVRDIGGGCGEATRNVVEKMNNLPSKWISGKQRGKPVKVLYTLPVRFKLDDNGKDVGLINTNLESNKNHDNEKIDLKSDENIKCKNGLFGYDDFDHSLSFNILNSLYDKNNGQKPILIIDGIETNVAFLENKTFSTEQLIIQQPQQAIENYGIRGKFGSVEFINPTFTFKN